MLNVAEYFGGEDFASAAALIVSLLEHRALNTRGRRDRSPTLTAADAMSR